MSRSKKDRIGGHFHMWNDPPSYRRALNKKFRNKVKQELREGKEILSIKYKAKHGYYW